LKEITAVQNLYVAVAHKYCRGNFNVGVEVAPKNFKMT
jgi:hypothetical protein